MLRREECCALSLAVSRYFVDKGITTYVMYTSYLGLGSEARRITAI